MSKKARVFNIVQDVFHPVTGKPLLTEEQIKLALAHKSIRDWAYVKHDKDVYSVDDEENNRKYVTDFYNSYDANKEHGELAELPNARTDRDKMTLDEYLAKYMRKRAGKTKPEHFHIVCRSEGAIDVDTIARWFGVPANFVECPKGRGAFLDCIEYLPHESKKAIEQGKYHYSDDCIKANFDFRKELTEKTEKQLKYGKDISDKDTIRHQVLYEGLSISELCSTETGRLAYQDDCTMLDKFRLKYIQKYAPMPSVRINYYVYGKGGDGKDIMCKALARALCPEVPEGRDEDIFFEVGANNATFEGYDGQPVIIWNDFRAGELLKVLGGRGNVFKVFDMFPTGRGRQNVKYGSITLINRINIVNSVQNYEEFLDGLAGNYTREDGSIVELAEDKGQSYRRFPFIIPIREKDFDIMMNRGVFEGTREYQQYLCIRDIRGSMKDIATRLGGDTEKRRRIENRTVTPIVDRHNELVEKSIKCKMSKDEIDEEFSEYGKQKHKESYIVDIDLDGNYEETVITNSDEMMLDDFGNVYWDSEYIKHEEESFWEEYERTHQPEPIEEPPTKPTKSLGEIIGKLTEKFDSKEELCDKLEKILQDDI